MPHYEIEKSILDKYYNAIFMVSMNHSSTALKEFAFEYPKEYKIISGMSRKRTQLNKDIYAMLTYSKSICWFTLTFDEGKNLNLETSKRKDAFIFLNGVFSLFVVVEEYGEDKGRYHLHGFGVFKSGKTLEDFYLWHSREDIYLMNNESAIKKKIKYLTNYAVKSVPRLHRNKNLITLRKTTDKTCSMVSHFPNYAKQLELNNAFLLSLDIE